MTQEASASRFLTVWLQGTTCQVSANPTIVWQNDTFILLKHHGHTGYTDRVMGNQYCPTYYSLYHKSYVYENEYAVRYGRDSLKTWTGRVNRREMIAECENWRE